VPICGLLSVRICGKSHGFGGGDADEVKAVGDGFLYHGTEGEPERGYSGIGFVKHLVLVVKRVEQPGQLKQVIGKVVGA